MEVQPRHCRFHAPPVYLSSLLVPDSSADGTATLLDFGTVTHLPLLRSDNTTASTADGFRAVLSHPLLGGAALLRAARRGDWRLSWLAASGTACGTTPESATPWQQTSRGAIFVDISALVVV